MAVKTITIDLEAYEALKRQKRKGQPFSQVIKEHFAGTTTGADLAALLEGLDLSDETLEEIDHQIEARSNQPAEAPDL